MWSFLPIVHDGSGPCPLCDGSMTSERRHPGRDRRRRSLMLDAERRAQDRRAGAARVGGGT
jgi:hypothetical protein